MRPPKNQISEHPLCPKPGSWPWGMSCAAWLWLCTPGENKQKELLLAPSLWLHCGISMKCQVGCSQMSKLILGLFILAMRKQKFQWKDFSPLYCAKPSQTIVIAHSVWESMVFRCLGMQKWARVSVKTAFLFIATFEWLLELFGYRKSLWGDLWWESPMYIFFIFCKPPHLACLI